MHIKILIALLLTIVSSCIQKDYVIKEFYPSNNIRSLKFYHNKNDSIPYKSIKYYNSGEVKDSLYYNSKGELQGNCFSCNKEDGYKKWTSYICGVKNGVLLVKHNDGRIIKKYFKDDLLNGIQTSFDNEGHKLNEILWIDNKPVARRLYKKYFPGDTIPAILNDNESVNHFDIVRDSITLIEYSIINEISNSEYEYEPIGSLHLKEGKVNENSKYNSYSFLYLKDTVRSGDTINVKLRAYLTVDEDVSLILKMGEMNFDLIFKDTIREIQSSKGSASFSFSIDKYHDGYNLLTGEVYYLIDTLVIGKSLIFEDFIVEE